LNAELPRKPLFSFCASAANWLEGGEGATVEGKEEGEGEGEGEENPVPKILFIGEGVDVAGGEANTLVGVEAAVAFPKA